MRIYLTLKSIPELTALPANERRLAWYACSKATFRHWQTWAGAAAGGLASLGIGYLLLQAIIDYSPFDRLITYFAGGFICGMIIVACTDYGRRVAISSQISPYLRAYLENKRQAAAGPSNHGAHGEHGAFPGKKQDGATPPRKKIDLDYLEQPFKDE
jgi:hypothetical protein